MENVQANIFPLDIGAKNQIQYYVKNNEQRGLLQEC